MVRSGSLHLTDPGTVCVPAAVVLHPQHCLGRAGHPLVSSPVQPCWAILTHGPACMAGGSAVAESIRRRVRPDSRARPCFISCLSAFSEQAPLAAGFD